MSRHGAAERSAARERFIARNGKPNAFIDKLMARECRPNGSRGAGERLNVA